MEKAYVVVHRNDIPNGGDRMTVTDAYMNVEDAKKKMEKIRNRFEYREREFVCRDGESVIFYDRKGARHLIDCVQVVLHR